MNQVPEGEVDVREAVYHDIRTEYVTGPSGISLRGLAKKYGASFRNISKRCKAEKWVELRIEHWNKVFSAAQDKVVAEQAQRISDNARLLGSAKKVWANTLVGFVVVNCPECGKAVRVPVPKIKPNFGDIERIIRVEELIMGRPDSRPANVKDEALEALDVSGLLSALTKNKKAKHEIPNNGE